MARRFLQQMRPRISMIRYESEQVNSQFSGSVPVFYRICIRFQQTRTVEKIINALPTQISKNRTAIATKMKCD